MNRTLTGRPEGAVLDCTYRVHIAHEPGQLARVCGAIADEEGLIGDVVTVSLTREVTVREITVEVRDADHAQAVADALAKVHGVRVLWHTDRALLRHEGGKLRVDPVTPVKGVQDMRDVYTPGVARVCQTIAEDPDLAHRYTMIGHSVAICTNGTRVLGLGDIGPVASMPVMEGKAIFYKQCAGLDAFPILIDTKDPGEFVETVVRIAPTFGGIHLEDISAPECFEIERRLIERLPQPVMHDDVHGTAVVTLAAALVACGRAGLDLHDAVVGQLGLGAAGIGIARLMVDAGARRVLAFDPVPASHERALTYGVGVVDMDTVMREADVVVATTGVPGLIRPEMVRTGQVILALTNPVPEIEPDDALRAGAAFAADGSSVNNVLGYPGIFRGALDAGAKSVTPAMKLAAAQAIADLTVESELVPDALDPHVHACVAEAVRKAAAREPAPV
jgi:malate dehydrogenase (oxaloacetate-decarboxylating)